MLGKREKQQRIAQFRGSLERLLAREKDDQTLRDELQAFGRDSMLPGFVWLWGPQVYARNRALFRPFILANFSQWIMVDRDDWTMERVQWEGEAGAMLEDWLKEADRQDDVALFKLLYNWKRGDFWSRGREDTAFLQDLRKRYEEARTPAERAIVLRKFDLWRSLDEYTALLLYEVDPQGSAEYILKHLPGFGWGEDRKLWERLFAASANDAKFRYRLYRRQAPLSRWREDTARLARDMADPQALNQALIDHHPEGWGLDLGAHFHTLVQARGQDVLPYVRKHLRNVWSYWHRSGYDQMLAHARRQGWWEFWSALVCVCARPQEYNAEFKSVLNDFSLTTLEQQHRLQLLSGVSREWNFAGFGLAQIQQLDEENAVALYRRFPDLARGTFRAHLAPTWGYERAELLEAAIAAGDSGMVDFLCARLITRVHYGRRDKMKPVSERAAEYYGELRLDEIGFARRAAAVLTQVPAYTIYDYPRLIEGNRLARMLFERSASHYLSAPSALRDLVEGSEIHVMALAYRVLGLDDDRARAQALENLDLLLGTLLRPMQRKTRLLAFRALDNAAHTLEGGTRVLARARDALRLPDIRYPKDALVGLIGRVLARHPQLAEPAERPVIYGLPPDVDLSGERKVAA